MLIDHTQSGRCRSETSTATKKVLARVSGGRNGMGADVPDENEWDVQHRVGDEEILEVHRVEMTMTRMVEQASESSRAKAEKKRYNTPLMNKPVTVTVVRRRPRIEPIEVYSPCLYPSVRVLAFLRLTRPGT